jgi:hypothetical protein
MYITLLYEDYYAIQFLDPLFTTNRWLWRFKGHTSSVHGDELLLLSSNISGLQQIQASFLVILSAVPTAAKKKG